MSRLALAGAFLAGLALGAFAGVFLTFRSVFWQESAPERPLTHEEMLQADPWEWDEWVRDYGGEA